eukprot:scaffold501_cov407-Prasinococcus_capsulatus_cf.AAC.9
MAAKRKAISSLSSSTTSSAPAMPAAMPASPASREGCVLRTTFAKGAGTARTQPSSEVADPFALHQARVFQQLTGRDHRGRPQPRPVGIPIQLPCTALGRARSRRREVARCRRGHRCVCAAAAVGVAVGRGRGTCVDVVVQHRVQALRPDVLYDLPRNLHRGLLDLHGERLIGEPTTGGSRAPGTASSPPGAVARNKPPAAPTLQGPVTARPLQADDAADASLRPGSEHARRLVVAHSPSGHAARSASPSMYVL